MIKDYGTEIPKYKIESLACLLLPEIQRFFESEDGKTEFEKWQAEQAQAGKESE